MNSKLIEARSARVVVSGTDAQGKAWSKASSGFLWQGKDQIVTSLHGVPAADKIVVSCQGVSKLASVAAVLQEADLILLKTASPFDSCEAFKSANIKKPNEGTKLWTFGWHAGARGGSSRHFEKGYGSPETLKFLVSGAALTALQTYNIPSTDLDVYYVQGGLLPGYSGGPVVNANMQLVGIVDGGLNKGTSDYNWVIPSKYLNQLVASKSKSIPAEVAKMSGILFSANTDASEKPPIATFATGITESSNSSVISYSELGTSYEWVHTKTQSLYELGYSADDAEGVEQLLVDFSAAAGLSDATQLSFDIYEELNLGLVIAVPAGQGLTLPADQQGLVSDAKNVGGSYTGILFQHANWTVRNAYDQEVHPSDDNYFQDFIAELLINCHKPGETYCQLDEPTVRMISFGAGNKILKLGMTTYSVATQAALSYSYYSFAVRNGVPFGAQAQLDISNSPTGLFYCFNTPDSPVCTSTSLPKLQLSQMIAVHLTSFAGLESSGEQKIVQQQFVYDSSKDYADTVRIPYYEENQGVSELRLYNTRGIQWKLYIDNTEQILTEYKARENGYVFLRYQDQYVSVYVAGGKYYFGVDGGEWNEAGTLHR
ncbi:MAG: serine protease [Pseudomonadales bacterium]